MPYYHVTATVNVKRIMKEGLLPRIGPRSTLMEQEAGVYLFNSQDAAADALANWLGDEFDEEFVRTELQDQRVALIEVTLPPDAKTAPTTAEYETVVTMKIPPQYLKLITRDF